MNAFYVINLLIYAGVDAMACLGLSQQFGVAGVTNFGFIIFQAAGGYAAAILAMPPKSANGGFQSYIGGWNLPFPIPWIGAAIAGGVIALPFTFLVGRRLRGDFAAVGLLVTAVLLNLLVTNYVPLFNGDAGLSLIPTPLRADVFSVQSAAYQWSFALAAILLGVLVYLFVRRITESPYGRTLRAMRDNDVVADSLGKNLLSLRTGMLVIGGAVAGLSGGILVSYITTWSPAAWGYAETVVLFAAVIIGGAGNHRGAVLGAVLVPVGFEEVTRFIPTSNNLPPNLIPSLEWVAIGLLIVVFLWVRPQGVLPERKRVIALPAGDGAGVDDAIGDGDGAGPPPAAPAAPSAPRASLTLVRPSAASGQEIVLETAGLARDFGGVRAVTGVSLSVRHGTLTGLIGPNGAGKSTLLALLAGTLRPTSGTIAYLGQDITGMPAFRRARLGLVRTFQLASEFKRLTVMENLLSAVPENRGDSLRGAVAGKRYWKGDEAAAIARAQAVLRRFGLAEFANHYAGDLSGGQRRLVEIMRALMAEPGMLLLDEPMAGVHPNLARQIGNELVALCREGMTILMVEHELAIMDEFCDPVVVMAEGTVLAQGTMAQLRSRREVVEAYLVG
ncbi:MAG TPA: ATP-binding cassette domain-containing protein [Streptosporangiaceae bacterium]|jgi:branched-chain amino acid transport system permease protein